MSNQQVEELFINQVPLNVSKDSTEFSDIPLEIKGRVTKT